MSIIRTIAGSLLGRDFGDPHRLCEKCGGANPRSPGYLGYPKCWDCRNEEWFAHGLPLVMRIMAESGELEEEDFDSFAAGQREIYQSYGNGTLTPNGLDLIEARFQASKKERKN